MVTDAALSEGITQPGTRHDIALKLAWRFRMAEGCTNDEALERIKEWLRAHSHQGATLSADPERLVRTTLQEVRHYLHTHLSDIKPRASLEEHALDRLLENVRADVRREAAFILRYCAGRRTCCLGGAFLEALCGDRRVLIGKRRRRAYVVATEELCTTGILSLKVDYSAGKHGRIYSIHIPESLLTVAEREPRRTGLWIDGPDSAVAGKPGVL